MLILAGIFAYFTLSAYLAHYGLMTFVLLGTTLYFLGKAAERAGIFPPPPPPPPPPSPPLKDNNLDRVRYVQVNFRDWRKKEDLSLTWDVIPERQPGRYEFLIDSRLLVDSMMQKKSIVLYDAYNHVIPIDRYDYSWDEFVYNNSSGDGHAILKVRPTLS